MADGKITFDTALDNRQLEKELEAVQKKMAKATTAKETAEGKRLPLLDQLKELETRMEQAKEKMNEYRAAVDETRAAVFSNDLPAGEQIAARAALPEAQANYESQAAAVERLQNQWNALSAKAQEYTADIEAANAAIEDGTARTAELADEMKDTSSGIRDMTKAAADAAQALENRIISIAKRVFVFQLITKVLRAAREYMGGLLEKNAEYQAELAKLRAALATAFQPLYEVAVPILITVLRILTAIATMAANVLSFLFGKTLSQSAKNAKALNKEEKAIQKTGAAAEKAGRQLAGFDELNVLSDNATDSAAALDAAADAKSNMDFSNFDLDEYKKKIEEFMVYLGGALLAIGAILAFSGINVPLGLTLMAIGAAAIATVVATNWGAMDDDLRAALTNTALIVGAALFGLGAILAFSGVAVPLGIKLMALGAASLVAAAALNWNAVSEALKGPMGNLVAMMSSFALAVGLALAFSGVSLPIGLALIALGAAGLVTVGVLKWDTITNKLKEVWQNIKTWFQGSVAPYFTRQYWANKFASIKDGLVDAVQSAISWATSKIQSFLSSIGSFRSRVSTITMGSTGLGRSVSIPQVPMLARGAVIPPNAPFMAMLGDQSNGNNIEAPEDLIRRIVREEAGNIQLNQDFTFDVNLDGLTVARKLYKYNRQVSTEHGMSLIGSEA